MTRLYIDLLPSDLFPPLFLYFNSDELLQLLPQLENVYDFNRLFTSDTFWRTLWRRDISTFLPLPENPYQKYQEIHGDLSKLDLHYVKIEYLAENGYDILLEPLLFNRGGYNWALEYAAKGGHIKMVQLLLALGANHYNSAMTNAANGGHMDIIKLMLAEGAIAYNSAMEYAALGGYVEIVELMLGLGANNYNGTMLAAAEGGHMDIVELMLEKGADNYNLVMYYAAARGNTEIVELMLENGANNYNEALSVAKTKELRDLIKSYQNK